MKITKICLVCGDKFQVKPGYTTAKYCSLQCNGKARQVREDRKCRNCYKVFSFRPSQLKKYPNGGRYCSRECGYNYRVKKNALKPSSDKYGRTRRVADIEWQKAIREKDNYTCQRCGVRQMYIHTHHIATRGSRPDLKHEVSNGICLCNACHMWVHRNPKEAIRNGWLHNSGSN